MTVPDTKRAEVRALLLASGVTEDETLVVGSQFWVSPTTKAEQTVSTALARYAERHGLMPERFRIVEPGDVLLSGGQA